MRLIIASVRPPASISSHVSIFYHLTNQERMTSNATRLMIVTLDISKLLDRFTKCYDFSISTRYLTSTDKNFKLF